MIIVWNRSLDFCILPIKMVDVNRFEQSVIWTEFCYGKETTDTKKLKIKIKKIVYPDWPSNCLFLCWSKQSQPSQPSQLSQLSQPPGLLPNNIRVFSDTERICIGAIWTLSWDLIQDPPTTFVGYLYGILSIGILFEARAICSLGII